VSNGIGDLIADTAVGMFSGERRLDNFISRRDKERERELAAAKIKALDLMSPAYKAKLMKDQGVRDPLYLDIGSSYDQYYRAFKDADDAAFADQLTKGYKTQNFIAGVGNELAGLAALAGVLPGVTIEGIYESLRTPYQYNKKYFGDLSEQEDREVQNFIENNAISVQGGRAIVLVPEIVASIATINPALISRITGLMGRRNAGQTLSAVEQRQLLEDVREVEDFKMRNPNIGSISKTGDFTDVPDVRTAPEVSRNVPGMELIENLKTRTDKLGRPFTSEYLEKSKLLRELDENKYIDPRTNKPFTPEDWLNPKKPDGTPYSKSSIGTVRSKIRQGPGFLDKKAAYQKTYMAERKATEPGFQKRFNQAKKQEYYTSARKQKKSEVPTPGKSVLLEERNRLLGYMSEAARKQKKFKGELADYEDVYRNNKFVGVKDNKLGTTFFEAGYKGKLKRNEKLISDHPEATNIIDLVDTAKKFKYGKLNAVLSNYFNDFNRLPTPAELFNFLSADRNFLGYMSKKRMTQNPLEIHHMLGTRYDPTRNVQLTLRDRNDAAGKVFRNFVEGRIDEKTAIKQIKDLNVRVKLPGGKEFVGGKELSSLKALAEARKRLTRMVNKEIKENPNFKEEFKKYFNEVVYKRQEFAEGGSAIKIKDSLQKEIDENNKAYEEAERQFFQEGRFVEIPEQLTGISFGFSGIRDVQEDIKELYADELEDMRKYAEQINRPIELKAGEVLEETRKIMNKGERPLEIRPLQEGIKIVTENPLLRRALAAPWTLEIAALDTIESINNSIRGEEGQIDFEKRYPTLYEFERKIKLGVGKTPDEQDYVSFIDEINRAQDRGLMNISFNIVDLLSLIPDLALNTEYGNKIKETFNKYDEEELIAKPETFLGEIGAIGVEFGVPATQVTKIVNGLRRGLGALTGRNLFARTSYNMKGLEKYKTEISNVFKRAGTAAAVGGGTGIVAGGYNTISQQYKDDPLLLDQTLGYDYEDTTDLTGRDLVLANFRNRLRFGGEDALIAGMFPLLGGPLWQVTKYGAIKPGVAIGSAAVKTVDTLAIKPVTYLASKDPFVLPGIARGTKIFADFLGKDVVTRAVVTAMGARPGLIKELPDYKDWRMFELTSDDPLQRSLKKFDNVLSFFRDVGRNSANSFFLTTKTERSIRARSREIEKYIESIERKAYDLANGFAGRYKTGLTSPAGEKYILEQVLEVLKGKLDIDRLPEELIPMVKGLDDLIIEIKKRYKDILPEDDALRIALTKNIKEYMRQSFQVFKNPQYKPDKKVYNDAVRFMENRIRANESLVMEALKKGGIQKYARDSVDDILHTTRTEGRDPVDQLNRISQNILKMDDTLVQTGEELPDVIKKLLGEEAGSLREAVLTTTTDLLTISSRTKMYDELADLLVAEGRLFDSADAARAARVFDAVPVGRVAGLGNYGSKIENLYGSREVTDALKSSGGVLDKLLENEYVGGVMQGLVGYKAMVQSGKTVLSPATQTRNFGSASLFPLLNGWIGGNASVRDAFKIVMDDIFGAGRTVNEEALIKNIGRKIELGVLDENIVASELQAVLKDIKAGKITKFGDLANKLESNPIMKQATRVYAGGDNIWKWYSHEYVMSMLKHAFKTTDEVKKAYADTFGVTKTFQPKNMTEALEEYAAAWVRDVIPTYSKVPPSIQAIRKIPFIGNFVSFPAEIFRTVLASSSIAMRNIASDNAVLREAGLRTMIGSAVTLGAVNETMKGLGYLSTNVNEEMMSDIRKYFAADFQKFSELMPISNYENGVVKVFDLSRYNPYDVVIAPVKNLIARATNPEEKLDPEKIDQDVFKEFTKATGPLYDLLKDTFFGISIGYEPISVAFNQGKTKTGKSVYGDTDTAIEKFDKFIMNAANTIEPGALSSLQRMYGAIAGDVTATGLPRKIRDELAKLFGAAPVEIDVKGSFAFDIGDFQASLRDPRTSEGYYSTKNWRQRGPDQLVREYNQMNEEAFRAQYEFYKVIRAALKHNLMTRKEIKDMMKDRKISEKNINRILNGRFIPLATGEGGLEGRYDKILRSNPEAIRELGKYYFVPKGTLNARKRFWSFQRFEDYEKQLEEAKQIQPGQQSSLPAEPVEQKPQTPQLPDTGAAQAGPPPLASAPNPATGLTPVESSLLSREEQLIRQRQRGLA
jgi:hypothetical protein